MNILFCNYEYPPLGGGGGVVNCWLAEELARTHDVTVLTSGMGNLPARENVNNVEIIRVPVYFRKGFQTANIASMAAYVFNAKKLDVYLGGNRRFDIVNTHFVVPTGPAGQFIADSLSIPNVLSVHGGDLYDPSKSLSPHRFWPLRRSIRNILHRASSVVGQSTNTISNVHEYYDESIECTRIPLGIPRQKLPNRNREKYGLSEHDFVLIAVGRAVSRKGFNQLLELLAKIDNSKLKLILVGDGPLLPDLKRQANERNVADRVLFAGQVGDDEKYELLVLSDLFVSTSQHEGFGLVFLEAMAAGLPVVSYNHGGQTDFIQESETGHLVELNNLSDFSERVLALMNQPQLKNSMSREANRVVQNYFIDSCARRYEHHFSEILQSHEER